MAIILVINIIIFILAGCQLARSSNIKGRVKDSDNKSSRTETIQRVQNALCIVLLLGFTWIFGYFLLIKCKAQYLFNAELESVEWLDGDVEGCGSQRQLVHKVRVV